MIVAHAAFESVVHLTISQSEARFLRTLLGSLAPADFAADSPIFNLVRAKHPDHLINNSSIAQALITLLGNGIGEAS